MVLLFLDFVNIKKYNNHIYIYIYINLKKNFVMNQNMKRVLAVVLFILYIISIIILLIFHKETSQKLKITILLSTLYLILMVFLCKIKTTAS